MEPFFCQLHIFPLSVYTGSTSSSSMSTNAPNPSIFICCLSNPNGHRSWDNTETIDWLVDERETKRNDLMYLLTRCLIYYLWGVTRRFDSRLDQSPCIQGLMVCGILSFESCLLCAKIITFPSTPEQYFIYILSWDCNQCEFLHQNKLMVPISIPVTSFSVSLR